MRICSRLTAFENRKWSGHAESKADRKSALQLGSKREIPFGRNLSLAFTVRRGLNP